MMTAIGKSKPAVSSRLRPDSLGSLKLTLRDYYAEKQQTYADTQPQVVDLYLHRMFSNEDAFKRRETAASFLRRFQTELRNRVAWMSHQPKYLVDQALAALILRCRELDLRTTRPTPQARVDATILVTIMTMRFVQGSKLQYHR